MLKKKRKASFAVFGLGRFGMSIVETLSEYDVQILACDKNERNVQEASSYATHVIQADISDEAMLRTMDIGSFDVVIIAMGNDFEAAQILAMVAKEQGVSHIIVRAKSKLQKEIFEKLEINEVILPEYEMGVKVAHRLRGLNIKDILEDSDLYTISEMQPKDEWLGKSIRQADIRKQYNLMIIAIRRGNNLHISPAPEWVINAEDVLVVLSEHKKG
jgi:trk system potassium uptake protein TrkA